MMRAYFQLTRVGFLFILQYYLGTLVRKDKLLTNYSRKIYHFAMFGSTVLSNNLFDYGFDYILTSALVSPFVLLVFSSPILARSATLRTMFLALDRPDDRPNTFFWLINQIVVGNLVIVFLARQFTLAGISLALLGLPIVINGVGDGLAEPVGVRFGAHKYNVKGFLSSKVYTRSLEGSSMVFIVCLLAVLMYSRFFSFNQLLISLILLPPMMTLTEAVSPHTWDNPFQYLVGGLFVLFTKLWL
jgi:phytol kinase